MYFGINFTYLLNALVFSILGIGILGLGLLVFDKFTPFKMWNEILEEHNVALAIVVGACCVGLSIIIAAAVH